MSKKKKINPRRKPLKMTEGDLNKAKNKAQDEAIDVMLNMVLYVLADKFGWQDEMLHRFYFFFNRIAEEISVGKVKLSEIKAVLKDEYGIEAD